MVVVSSRSSFSANSGYYKHDYYPPSEELDSEESEISYDSVEDRLRPRKDEYEVEEDSELQGCMWGARNLLHDPHE